MTKKQEVVEDSAPDQNRYKVLGLFSSRLQKAMEGRSNRSLAEQVGISDTTVRDYLRRKSYPTLDRLEKIAEALDVRVAWLAAGDPPMREGETIPGSIHEEFIYINNLDVEAAAGSGSAIDTELVKDRMAFRKDWLRRHNLQKEHLCFITTRGDSMEPLIRSGDTLLVSVYCHREGPPDRQRLVYGLERNARHGKEGIFVLRIDGGLVVKRLQPNSEGGYLVSSDNPSYSPLKMSADEVDIVGRVEWIGRRL